MLASTQLSERVSRWKEYLQFASESRPHDREESRRSAEGSDQGEGFGELARHSANI
jgi:hypothetical protein